MRRKTKRNRYLTGVVAVLTAIVPTVAAGADVTPSSVSATIAPGEEVTITKTVDVPESPPKADIYFLADTTGSMGSIITSVKSGASTILGSLDTSITDVQFGAGDYKDFPFDSYAFQNGVGISPDDGVGGALDASDVIQSWSAFGGADLPEGQLYALDQITELAAINWRTDSNRIVVWFGDAPGHDPVCSAISGLGYDITEASATAKLVADGVTVIAISTLTGVAGGLDGDPTSGATNYSPTCATINGTVGQATRIADATGGVHVTGIDSGTIVDAILNAIAGLTFTITADPVGCEPLDVTFDPASHTDIAGGTSVLFEETVAVPASVTEADLPADNTVNCTVDFKANGATIGTQDLAITVSFPDTEAEADFDVLPTSCPNPFRLGQGGQVPAAILGSDILDVTDIDTSTVELSGPGGTTVPTRSSVEDVAGPDAFSEPAARNDCGTQGPDGHDDLTLKFDASEFEGVLGSVAKGDVVIVEISAETFDGGPVTGSDIVWIR